MQVNANAKSGNYGVYVVSQIENNRILDRIIVTSP